MIGEALYSAFQIVISVIPLKYAYGLAGLIIGLLLGLTAGAIG